MRTSVSTASDEMLASRAAAGDGGAFEEIVARCEGRIFRLACRLTNDTDAPDVLQETFLQVYRHLPSFRGDSQFGTWIYRIATNASLMLRRAQAVYGIAAADNVDVECRLLCNAPPVKSLG